MMKRILYALLLTCCFNSFAQNLNFSVKWGAELDAPKRSSLDDIVGYDATGIYAVKVRYRGMLAGGNDYTLEHYDNNFARTKSFDLELAEEGKDAEVNYLLHLKSKLFMFYSISDSKEKKNTLYVKEIDKSTLQPKKDMKRIGQIDFKGKSRRNDGFFRVRVSRDSSKVLVFYSLPYDSDEPEAFGFNVLDDKLNSLWEKTVTIPYKNELFDVESFRVDNSGNAYLLGVNYKEKRKSKRHGQPNYTYEIFAYREKGTQVKQYPISLEDRFLTDMQIEVLDNKNIVCAGFYSKMGTYSVDGTYFLVVDAGTKAIKTKSFKEFSLDFITQGMSEKEAKKATKKDAKGQDLELYEYDLDKLLVGKDGSAMLIGEQYFVRVQTISNGRTTQTIYHYYYNDIIAVKINAAGQIEWNQKISKSQHTINDGGFYSSYTMAILKGKICFFFNDNPDNLVNDGKGRPANYNARKSVVVMASLDQKGNVTKQPLFNSVDVDVITRPKVCEQISNNEVILFGQRKKNQQFARVTFN